MFKKILVVTDFSPNSLKALTPAIALAKVFEGTIYLCHVDEEESALSAHSSDELITFLQNVETKRATWLESMANEIRSMDVTCEIVRLKGWASNEIVTYAEQEQMDLTVISALGGQGFKALLMGSTSSNVLRNFRRPLMFISAHCTPPEDFSINRILFPTYLSARSGDGAKYVAKLCKSLEARLDLFHAMKIPAFIPALPGEAPLVLPPTLLDKMDNRFEELTEQAEEYLDAELITCEVAAGDEEAETISQAAVTRKSDLIVIRRQQQGLLDGLVFGRIAEDVARLAPVPVLLFQVPESES
jgi:nucleotide-binding universal stress UspA family protein